MQQSKSRRKQPGSAPGTLVYTGEHKVENVSISIFDYDGSQYQEKRAENIEECSAFGDKSTVTWINIIGLHDVDVIEKIGGFFNLHPLMMEDILNTTQRPKLEDFESSLFIVAKMLSMNEKGSEIHHEQVSFILGSNYVISFQEQEGDVFDPIRERIRKGKGKIRKMGSDYLVYALLDAIVDNYFVILENFSDKLEEIEDELLAEPKIGTLHTIHKLKRQAIILRKSIWPLREVVNTLERGESDLIQESTRIYFKDIYDHTIQVIENVETFRDTISSMTDLYLSTISNRMNETMKVLTIIATIFIPLTFIAGIYGMNFRNMPELDLEYGYFITLIIMIIIGILMAAFFKNKKWL